MSDIHPNWLALTLNTVILARYVWRWDESGRIIYWLGATLLTIGLLRIGRG